MSFFGTLHEMGHGLYEHGISPSLERTLLCRGVSLSLHQSQSRMWENLVGRSRPFWRFAFTVVREVFPDHFAARYDEEAVYRSTNKIGSIAADPGGGQTTDIQPAHHPALRDRTDAIQRRDQTGRPRRGLEREGETILGIDVSRITPMAYCRTSTGARGCGSRPTRSAQ